jgi:L-lactate utilization protein LutC
MNHRSAILERLRQAQRTGRVPGSDAVQAPDAPFETSVAKLADRFFVELAALGVEPFHEPTPEAVGDRLRALVAGQSVLAWDPAHVPYGVGEVIRGAALGSSPRSLQAAAAVGVTGATAAIAETGTLAMLSGPGRPRAASLLPPTHVAIVRPADLCASMGEFFTARAGDIAASACCYFISGPSRTADIELTLTLGVHGPGRVCVILGP